MDVMAGKAQMTQSSANAATTPAERYRRHKAGGRTSVRSVRERGRGLRQDLVGRARNERELIANLRAAGYEVEGSPTDFCGPTR